VTGSEFFAIDVSSEIRNLCDAQLRGTWQMPAELVRFAVRCGAPKVSVTGGWRGYSVRWTGGPIALATIENLALALDDSAGAATRQRAIADLESNGAEALLWAGGAAGARLQIDGKAGGKRLRMVRRPGRAPRLVFLNQAAPTDEVVLGWQCSRLDRRRADLWLGMACRFSTVDVTVDGRPVPKGFAGGLYRMRLVEPVPCTLGLTRCGEEPVLWLLRDGVVAARAVLPDSPPFEAAVELGGVAPHAASSSDLRRAVMPFVSELCDRAVQMMIQVASRPSGLIGPDGQRVRAALLRAAKRGLRVHEIRSLPLLQTVRGGDRLLSVDRLEAIAQKSGGRLYTVEPGTGADGLLADAGSIVVASPEVRNLLVELTGIRLQPPPRRRAGRLRRLAEGGRATARRAIERVRGMMWNRILPADALSPEELRLLALLGAALSPRTVTIGAGAHLRRTSTGFVLPRFDTAVADAARRAGDDPAWVYLLILALHIENSPLESLRASWRTLVSGL
jgi:hypothetical protein